MGRKTLWWLVIILIIAGFLRFYHLDIAPPGLYPDEAMDGNNALSALHTGDFKVFYPPNNGVEGLYANIEAMTLSIAGVQEPWTLRFPAAVFGFLTVLGVFFLARELFKKDSIALLSAFFLATSFWHINFSRIGFRAIMAPFFIVWALYFFLKSIEAQRARSWVWYSALGGLAFGLGFHSYISYRILPLLFLLFIPFFFRQKNFWRATAVFVLAAFIAILPLGLYFLENPADFLGRTSQVSVFSSENPTQVLALNTAKTVGMLNFLGDGNWRHNLAGRPQLFWPVGIVFWVGALFGFVAILRRNHPGADHAARSRARFTYLLLFGWIALAALPVVFSNEGIPHALRAILMIPPLMILAGAGAAWLYEWTLHRIHKHRRVLFVGALVILSLLAFEGAYTYFVAWARNPNTAGAFNAEYVEIGRQVRVLPDDVPKQVFVNAGGVGVPLADPWSAEPRTHDVPVPAQSVMFLTDSYLPEQQKQKNIHYILPDEEYEQLPNAAVFHIN